MAYTTIDNPELYFQVKLYTGTGSENAITLDGDTDMQPDLVWIKCRSDADNHPIHDSIRGATNVVHSDTTDAEYAVAQGLKSFDSDGFTLGTSNFANQSSRTFVAWCWKAGSAFSNDASATSIGDIDSSGSASTTAGFSICSYTGSGSAGDEIKHGLDKTPEMLIFRNRTTTITWIVGSKPSEFTNILFLQSTDAATDDSNAFNDTDPTSSVFTLGGDAGTGTNETSSNFVCYAFASIQGYSKIGSYTGNGSTASPFIFLGFRPAFVLIRNVDSVEGWHIFDNKRDGYNAENRRLYPHSDEAEANASQTIDMLSNGFKVRSSTEGLNKSGDTIIFAAFAEAPFVNSNGVPCNAR